MARSIWSGAISFGLINIPVELMPAESRVDLHFHLVDARDKARIRYERVNADTGEEVPWKDIVKAFEFEKGNYVVVTDKDFKAASPEHASTIDIEGFVKVDEIGAEYVEKPYFLVPGKRAEKGYVLLRETLKKQRCVGIARIVIRSREQLTMLVPKGEALMLFMLRYPQELLGADRYSFPDKPLKAYRIADREIEMAGQLVESMTTAWQPKDFHDEYREKLSKLIQSRIRQKGGKVAAPKAAATAPSGKVVDFMALLKKSIDSKQRTPAALPAKRKAAPRSSETAAKPARASRARRRA